MENESQNAGGLPVSIRRVVTGNSPDGSANVVLDGVPPRSDAFRHVPGMVSRLVWATPATAVLPFDGVDPTEAVRSLVPGTGETRFLVVTFPPDSVFASADFDPRAAAEENAKISPGLAELFEADGMHTTPSIDYGIVLDGEIWLELDDGRVTYLRQHDLIVQNGTRHAWRNRSTKTASVAFVLVGAQRVAVR
ncbi:MULTISPECIES: cupin domain-containing protein [Paraburkholderia]|uniref:Cupin n=1 Tax=Paraburkholderia nemoris TaxID=2793076 RepID=A0ABM8T5L9_9BURK|nr:MULTISPECIES: cupin domain-containing protein [Paraburkholderia]KPD15539.1 cupin [Burkholderia sp. ST111]MBK5151867.1 cupin domain-containing protein [Burkholderia sp. R-69608]MBK5185821.1 cupin domain-containing protein [Burkholderia sp. R-69749]MBK3743996.1 cupin domain-containing protein [Paraburkholderia aspalathi]MBK3816301.1 cupin domain-containing protein [Paraburkholderia aspalathi]